MKSLPDSREGWIDMVLFPFKSYVVMGLPFLAVCRWSKGIIQPRFYGYPEEATFSVSAGYVLCVAVLLTGAMLQAVFIRPGNCLRTIGYALLGIAFLGALWPWGMIGR